MHRPFCSSLPRSLLHVSSIHKTTAILRPMAFIGRERELEALGAALERASAGDPARVALSGPLGIGITRLVDELGERLARTSGATLCRVRCHAPMNGVAYGALRDAL